MTPVADSAPGRSGCDVTWTVCPVTLNALAFVDDAVIGTMLNYSAMRSTVTRFEIQRHEMHADLIPLQGPLASLTFRAWAHGRFIAEIALLAADGRQVRFVDQDFAGIGLLPATVLTALHGRPLAAYCDHPMFDGVAFDRTDELGAPRAPASSIPVDGMLGARIQAARASLLERHPHHG